MNNAIMLSCYNELILPFSLKTEYFWNLKQIDGILERLLFLIYSTS